MAKSSLKHGRGKDGVMLLPLKATSPEHEQETHRTLGKRIASLLGVPFFDADEGAKLSPSTLYHIPPDTLVGADQYRKLGIETELDFFGGLVAEDYMGSKAISHPLCPGATRVPASWSNQFHNAASKAVLRGYTAFCARDALLGAEHLLREGPVRVKPVRARAGKGQWVVDAVTDLERYLAGLDQSEIHNWGLVLEENLTNVATYSVGRVLLAGIEACYCGTQQLTLDNDGELVYGGSSLQVVRGDYGALLSQLSITSELSEAVALARVYDQAADDHLPGFMASRRNYDVVQGTDSKGQRVCGVLEQSWRIGGASSAEVFAIEVFKATPSLSIIKAATIELYGQSVQPPAGTTIIYQGDDPEVGYLTKCVRIGI